MFKYVFKETMKKQWRNKKLRLLFVLTFFLIVVYLLLVLPGTSTSQILDSDLIESRLDYNYGVKENEIANNSVQFTEFTGSNTFEDSKVNFENLSQLHYAIQDGDLNRVQELRMIPMETLAPEEVNWNPLFTPRESNNFALTTYYDRTYATEMLNTDDISVHMLENKTSIQQLHRFMERYLPLAFLIITVFIASEVLVDDRKHRTIKSGKPIGWRMYILYKSIAVFVITSLYAIGTLGFFTLLNGLLFGFGPINLAISDYALVDQERLSVFRGDMIFFETQNAWIFVLLCLLFIIIMMFIVIRISMLLSLLFRNDMIVLVLGIMIVSVTSIYLSDGSVGFLGIEPWYLPQNYIEIGRALLGEPNFVAFTDQFTYVNGLIAMGAAWIIVEILLFVTAFFMNRQRFERQVR